MTEHASSGHKLGQLVGDWFEEFFVWPLLQKVADHLKLYLDHRFMKRPIRGDKIIWKDTEGNKVDYDFVFEIGGSQKQIGVPVAFVESFWRRGARHSKDKARDESGKLIPMRDTYPTARFLGIVGAGDFTEPARTLVRHYDIDLFYIPKEKVIDAFKVSGLSMDYLDTATEVEKQVIASEFARNFSKDKKIAARDKLIELVGNAAMDSYINRVRSKLSALPQEICFILRRDSAPIVFPSIPLATQFLENPQFEMKDYTDSYVYQVVYSDGSEFEQVASSVDDLRKIHQQVETMAEHINKLLATK